jgi:hypothetical protein
MVFLRAEHGEMEAKDKYIIEKNGHLSCNGGKSRGLKPRNKKED